MKLKNLFELLGFKRDVRQYGYEIRQFTIDDAVVQYAQWLHPKESEKVLRQEHVDRLREYLKPGDVAIDIGAHTGDTTLPMALAVGKTGRVLALEPNPYVFQVLAKNATLNPERTSIEALNFAATERDGPVEFAYSDPGFCNGGNHEEVSRWNHGCAYQLVVDGRNLETYLRRERAELLPRLRYLKVDAEGYDATILATLQSVLRQYRPVVKVEFYKHSSPSKRRQLWDLLDSLGYQVYRVNDLTDFPQDQVLREHVNRWTHFDSVCFPAAARVKQSA